MLIKKIVNFNWTHNETQLVFTPALPWKSGHYSITVMSILEDLAGNNLNHLFDVDLTDSEVSSNNVDEQKLAFEVL